VPVLITPLVAEVGHHPSASGGDDHPACDTAAPSGNLLASAARSRVQSAPRLPVSVVRDAHRYRCGHSQRAQLSLTQPSGLRSAA
jgi:hypothetical protein